MPLDISVFKCIQSPWKGIFLKWKQIAAALMVTEAPATTC